jgi:hypothetical protein
LPTRAITNRAESAIFKGFGLSAKSAKSLGFCFVEKKEKTKPKGFAKCLGESNRLSAALLVIAETVTTHLKKKIRRSDIHLTKESVYNIRTNKI